MATAPDGPHEPGDAVVKLLFASNGRCCAFHDPDGHRCDCEIVSPKWKRTRGQIVHIKADKPGGPRYDATQPNSERHGFANLMVMCPNHHQHIDWLRPDDYPPTVLYDMKAMAEADPKERWGDAPWLADEVKLAAVVTSAIIGYRTTSGDYAKASETIESIESRLRASESGVRGEIRVTDEDDTVVALGQSGVRHVTTSPDVATAVAQVPRPIPQADRSPDAFEPVDTRPRNYGDGTYGSGEYGSSEPAIYDRDSDAGRARSAGPMDGRPLPVTIGQRWRHRVGGQIVRVELEVPHEDSWLVVGEDSAAREQLPDTHLRDDYYVLAENET